ncbi:MAG: heavy metal translocating P-type ATPase, partial [Proteobacteria bacterium]|nr:heavy metal translocating P-type ATPase [Pseudomonadota bacterium]
MLPKREGGAVSGFPQALSAVSETASVASTCCTHCGEPVRPGAHAADTRFCCAGCAAVWHLLHARHLEHAYELHRSEGVRPPRGRQASMQAHLDHEAFQRRHVERLTDGSARCEFRVDGIRCGACLWLLESMPRLVPGTGSCRVNLGRGTLQVQWRPEHVPLSVIAGTIESLGYGVRPVGSPSSQAGWREQDRAWLVRLGVAGAIAGNTMAIAFALYGAQFAWMDASTRGFLQWASVGLGALSVFWPGRLYLQNAWQAVRSRTAHMDLPITVALLAGLLGGALMTALGRAGIYVESVSMLVFLLLVGRFVQFRQQRCARHEVELLCALVPQVARRAKADGGLEEVPTDALMPGDEVEVAAGDALPADGRLASPEAHIDAALLTGESRPVRRRFGETLQAGTVAVGSPLRMHVTCTGEATRAGRIAAAVDRALGER